MSRDLLEAFGSNDALTDNPWDSPTVRRGEFGFSPIRTDADISHTSPQHDRKIQKPHQEQPALWHTTSDGTDVLFDASLNDDDDEFGDFEGSAPTEYVGLETVKSQSGPSELSNLPDTTNAAEKGQHLNAVEVRQVQNATDLLGLFDDDPNKGGKADAVRAASAQSHAANVMDEWGDFESAINQSIVQQTSRPAVDNRPSRATATVEDHDNNWSDFEEWSPAVWSRQNEQPLAHMNRIKPQSSKMSSPLVAAMSSEALQSRERPTNIPPPFTLLQILPGAYEKLSAQCGSGQDQKSTSRIAKVILSVYRTTAHIISGRQHRWKRDTILAQSMRISAVNTKNSGMKLTSLDRGESIKEEQQTIDTLTAWAKYAHTLTAAMVKGGAKRPAMSLKSSMNVRVAKGPDIISSKESCAVCGLKREERVVGIDVDVSDAFGDFWTDHWGHTDCNDFWYMWKGELQQR